MSDKLTHHPLVIADEGEVQGKKKRMNLREMSPMTRQNYIRTKGREYKAKSRAKQREKLKTSVISEDMVNSTTACITPGENSARFEGILGECREMLTYPNEQHDEVNPSIVYRRIKSFLKDIFEKHPEFRQYMENDPRTKNLLEHTINEMITDYEW